MGVNKLASRELDVFLRHVGEEYILQVNVFIGALFKVCSTNMYNFK